MVGRVVAVACVALLALGVLLVRARRLEEPPAPVRPPLASIEGGEALLRTKATLRDGLRLAPDGRALEALSWVHHLLAGEPRSAALARYDDGRWHVRHGNRELGSVAEIPTLAELNGLLRAYARELGAGRLRELQDLDLEAPLERVRRFHHAAVFQGVETLGRLWADGKRDPRVVDVALRGLVYASLQLVDPLEGGDTVPARAWALLAIASEARTPSVDVAQALLWQRLGYQHEAVQAAAALEPGDPVRQWLEGDPGLFAMRGELERGALGTFLRAHVLARNSGREVWLRYVRDLDVDAETASYLFVMAGPARADWELRKSYGPVVMAHALASARWLVEPNASPAAEQPQPGAAEIEAPLARMLDRGQAFAAGLAHAFHLATWQAGVEHHTRFLLDELESPADAQAFLEQLRPTEIPSTRQYLALVDARVRRAAGDLEAAHALSLLRGSSLLRLPALEPAAHALAKLLPVEDPRQLSALEALAARGDSRRAHRLTLSRHAERGLGDLALSEALMSSLDGPAQRVRNAERARDLTALWMIADDEASAPGERADALRALHEQGAAQVDPARLDAAWLKLVSAAPESWHLVELQAKRLERERADPARARAVIEAWVARGLEREQPMEYLDARAALSRLDLALGDADSAWRRVEELVPSQRLPVLSAAAWALLRLERDEEARALIDGMLARYAHRPHALALVARLRWELGDHAGAALALAPARRWAADLWSERVAQALWSYTESCKRQPGTLAAFDALAASGAFATKQLSVLPERLGERGCHALGLRMLERLEVAQADAHLAVVRYRLMSATEGHERALSTLSEALVGADLLVAARELAHAGDTRALWLDAASFGDAIGEEPLWWERTLTTLARDEPRAERIAALDDHWTAAPQSHTRLAARHLLGHVPARDVLAASLDRPQQCRAGFALGLAAERAGRAGDALDWYLSVDRFADQVCSERRAARVRLTGLRERNRPLARLSEATLPSAESSRP